MASGSRSGYSIILFMPWLLMGICCLSAQAAAASPKTKNALSFHFAGVSERELEVAEELSELLDKHNLSSWLFTDKIRFKSGVIPHSHPVLTLNTRHLGEPVRLLTTFLHEQIHWLVADPNNRESKEAALVALRQIYPEVPDARNGGAADAESTYLHFIVNWLEFDALNCLLGKEKAQDVIESIDFYEWIYAQVLENGAQLESIISRNDLRISHKCR